MGFVLIIRTMLDEEELGRDGFNSTPPYQFISASIFIHFLLPFICLVIVATNPENQLSIGYFLIEVIVFPTNFPWLVRTGVTGFRPPHHPD